MRHQVVFPQCMQQANNVLGAASTTNSPLHMVLIFVLALLFLVVVSLMIYLLVNSLRREPVSPNKYLDILKERLARGEVSVEDFDAAKMRLV
jgi:uncharacterized membrane protein